MAALGACLMAMSCAGVAQRDAPTIVDVRTGRLVGEGELVNALAAADYRLLGERHDNPAHHALRARWIEAIARTGRRPAVVLEPFDLEHDAALRDAQRGTPDAERLADAGALDRKAWQWPLHRPIVEAAIAHALPLRAGNLSRSRLREQLKAAAPSFTGLRWSDAQQARLENEIVDGHCGRLPSQAVAGIVLAQRARDDAMAQALVAASTGDGAILVAGNGHVRNDVGVTPYLQARSPRASVVSVGLVETAGQAASPASLSRAYPQFDYVVVTDAVVRPDPCETIPAMPGR